jgi:MoxR-like ATPase
MEEFRVSVDGQTYDLPKIFMVLATQNPIDMAGTHPLPEAQLDRFFVRLHVGYPSVAEEVRILAAQAQSHPIETLLPVISESEVLAARDAIRAIHISADVLEYIVRISSASRQHADLRLGASPRGSLALARGSQGMAFLRGRDFVTPDIVKTMAGAVLEHRLIVRPQAAALGRTARDILNEILNELPPPV